MRPPPANAEEMSTASDGFEYEAEVRMLEIGRKPEGAEYRVAGTRLSSYVERDLPKDFASGVMLGPAQKEDYDALALKYLMIKLGLAGMNVYRSRHEFRP